MELLSSIATFATSSVSVLNQILEIAKQLGLI